MTRENILVDDDGMVAVPQTPGLGVHLNEETIQRYQAPMSAREIACA